MTLRNVTASAALCLGILSPLYAQEDNQPPDGFEALFNGTDLAGWHGMGHFDPRTLAELDDSARTEKREADLEDLQKHWKVENGEIINDGHGVFLTTDRQFGDIELWVDYKTVPKADSGIYLRTSPQVQIWDPKNEDIWSLGADKGSGGLWNNNAGTAGKDPLVLADNPLGQWNRFRIVQVGARTSVWLNGKQVVDHAIMHNFWDRAVPLFARGMAQLQTHGGEIRWKNIFVKELSNAESNEILASHGEDGFESIFNGTDFDGWQGATKNYEVKDGAIACKSHTGGTLYTNEEYGNFVARFEFKLPPKGNNGIAIRYPGNGQSSYTGMCELQVLDSEHPDYADLDDRQYHGSVYGKVAAHRGYLRPLGEWNFQEVTVDGSQIRVELNGSVIVDADISQVTEFMLDRDKFPGHERTTGYFGFCGHNDPVEFRAVRIKRLGAES